MIYVINFENKCSVFRKIAVFQFQLVSPRCLPLILFWIVLPRRNPGYSTCLFSVIVSSICRLRFLPDQSHIRIEAFDVLLRIPESRRNLDKSFFLGVPVVICNCILSDYWLNNVLYYLFYVLPEFFYPLSINIDSIPVFSFFVWVRYLCFVFDAFLFFRVKFRNNTFLLLNFKV